MLNCRNYGTRVPLAKAGQRAGRNSMKCNNILEAIGRTPLVRLNRINQGLKPQIYVKADYINPGGSVKDRIGITMIDEAEKKGLLKPGGTIIEGTSGNTGMGLALVAAVRGYKMVFTITDKQSKEKIDLLIRFIRISTTTR
jgi:cystathionine beta-synthase